MGAIVAPHRATEGLSNRDKDFPPDAHRGTCNRRRFLDISVDLRTAGLVLALDPWQSCFYTG